MRFTQSQIIPSNTHFMPTKSLPSLTVIKTARKLAEPGAFSHLSNDLSLQHTSGKMNSLQSTWTQRTQKTHCTRRRETKAAHRMGLSKFS